MMYPMKNIISHELYISLPKCMYRLPNPNESTISSEVNINISDQVTKLLKTSNKTMIQLEQRQDELLQKLDILYERIKCISSACITSSIKNNNISHFQIATPHEIVMNVNPDSFPRYLIFLSKESMNASITCHVHSSIPSEKIQKINVFMKNFTMVNNTSTVNFRLIFKCVSGEPELKLSSLAIPIVGTVNILRYFSLIYPNIVPYDHNDFHMDGLLDYCHVLERVPEKSREAILTKLFSQCKTWVYGNKFTIVDLAAYNAIKMFRSKPKSVPQDWFERCDKKCIWNE